MFYVAGIQCPANGKVLKVSDIWQFVGVSDRWRYYSTYETKKSIG